jgi:hypothetical protein
VVASGRPRYAMLIAMGLALVVIVLAAYAGAVYHVPDLIRHRQAHAQTLNGARLEAPGLWPWPQLSYEAIPSFCKLCKNVPSSNGPSRTIQLAWLVSDDSVTQSTMMPNVQLPRLVWVVTWKDACWSPQPAGLRNCITFDIVDDKNGRELDGGQAWTSVLG